MSEKTKIEPGHRLDSPKDSAASEPPPTDFDREQAVIATIRSVADRYRGDGLRLLRLLRLLEALHREIREGLFQDALPDNRQALHALLRDMEAEGGWPYINRMRLQSVLINLLSAAPAHPTPSPGQAESNHDAVNPSDSIESVE